MPVWLFNIFIWYFGSLKMVSAQWKFCSKWLKLEWWRGFVQHPVYNLYWCPQKETIGHQRWHLRSKSARMKNQHSAVVYYYYLCSFVSCNFLQFVQTDDTFTYLCFFPLPSAKVFAESAVQKQMSAFKRWAVMANWEDGCYYTINKRYETVQLETFFRMYEKVSTWSD